MNWNTLKEISQLEEIKNESTKQPVLIFKHSTSCSISRTTLDRLQRNWKEEEMQQLKIYYLDLLNHRDVSNQIAEVFQVQHESPQVLIIRNGVSVYTNSHFGIDYASIKAFAKN
jgi:bacillithiol system protein YtxJ